MRKYTGDNRIKTIQHRDRWGDIPPFAGKSIVRLKHVSGREYITTFSEKTTRVLLALQQGPLAALCKIRFGHYVNIINQESDCRDQGDHIDCIMCKPKPGSDSDDLGVYVLESKVERIDDVEVAA